MTQDIAFVTLGLVFLAGLLADVVGRRSRLPRVTLLMLVGLALGRSGLDLIPAAALAGFDWLSTLALSMVAFLMGGARERGRLRAHGRVIVVVSIVLVLASVAIVSLGLLALGVPAELALVLGALSCATDPAATRESLAPSDRQRPFAARLEGIVAIDDAWGLVVFGLAIVAAQSLTGAADWTMLGAALREVGGAVLLGVAVGLPAAALSGRIAPGEPLRTEALGIVFLTTGLALWLEVSFLLAAMTVGAVVVNVARHHRHAFDEIEGFRWPFMLLFFVLAGASLDLGAFLALGVLGLAYVGLRIAARLVGGWLGGWLAGAPPAQRRWFGTALLSQAGVAVGMALVAGQAFPEHAATILTVTIGATVVFELLGPLGVIVALRRVGTASGSRRGPL